jgi:hypothetical protein
MKITPAIASTLFASSTSAASLASTLYGGVAETTGAQIDPFVALKDAEKNGAAAVKRKAAEPLVKRDLDAFEKAVTSSKSVEEFFANPVAAKVFLTANDLGDVAGYKALVVRTLNSDYLDDQSLAARMGAQRGAYYETALKYDFHYSGLDVLQRAGSIAEIREDYAKALWRQSLDATAPGVSNALAFKERAASLDSAYKILGDPVGREVVTTALGLPQQIAYQPVSSQAALIERGIAIGKLKTPAYVDMLVKRYLARLNDDGGLTA